LSDAAFLLRGLPLGDLLFVGLGLLLEDLDACREVGELDRGLHLQVGEDLDGLDGVGDLVLHGGSGLGLLALVLVLGRLLAAGAGEEEILLTVRLGHEDLATLNLGHGSSNLLDDHGSRLLGEKLLAVGKGLLDESGLVKERLLLLVLLTTLNTASLVVGGALKAVSSWRSYLA